MCLCARARVRRWCHRQHAHRGVGRAGEVGKIESARPFVRTLAGVLTAAALGDDIWRWRTSLGPDTRRETSASCWTAWLLVDLIDTSRAEPGGFARIVVTEQAA